MGGKPRETRMLVENVNVPGRTQTVSSDKYFEMKRALVRVLPRTEPGLTQAEMIDAVKPLLAEVLFPAGATAAWWVKTVHLDLEAKGAVVRDGQKPLRWRQA